LGLNWKTLTVNLHEDDNALLLTFGTTHQYVQGGKYVSK